MAKKSKKKTVKRTPTTKRKSATTVGASVSLPEVLRWLERRGSKSRIKELDRYCTATKFMPF